MKMSSLSCSFSIDFVVVQVLRAITATPARIFAHVWFLAALEACAHLWSPGEWKCAVTPKGFGLHSVLKAPELENIGSLRPS